MTWNWEFTNYLGYNLWPWKREKYSDSQWRFEPLASVCVRPCWKKTLSLNTFDKIAVSVVVVNASECSHVFVFTRRPPRPCTKRRYLTNRSRPESLQELAGTSHISALGMSSPSAHNSKRRSRRYQTPLPRSGAVPCWVTLSIRIVAPLFPILVIMCKMMLWNITYRNATTQESNTHKNSEIGLQFRRYARGQTDRYTETNMFNAHHNTQLIYAANSYTYYYY